MKKKNKNKYDGDEDSSENQFAYKLRFYDFFFTIDFRSSLVPSSLRPFGNNRSRHDDIIIPRDWHCSCCWRLDSYNIKIINRGVNYCSDSTPRDRPVRIANDSLTKTVSSRKKSTRIKRELDFTLFFVRFSVLSNAQVVIRTRHRTCGWCILYVIYLWQDFDFFFLSPYFHRLLCVS